MTAPAPRGAALTRLTTTAVLLPVDNVDTDQIIPARFLKTVDREGMGRHLFADWRYDADGAPRPEFPLNAPGAAAARALVAGDNFGCGSSREHAAWALRGFGFQVVISTHFADIFRSNALKNGLLPVPLDRAAHEALVGGLVRDPALPLTIDLPAQTLAWPGAPPAHFPIDPFMKHCLVHGVDQLGFLLAAAPAIDAYEAAHPRRVRTTGAS